MSNNEMPGGADAPVFGMQKFYMKHLSFKNPNTPEIYTGSGTRPKVEMNIGLKNRKIDDEHWEVSSNVIAKTHISDLTINRLMFYSFCGMFFFIPVATSPAVIIGILVISLWVFSGRFIKDRRWLRQEWTLPVIMMMLLPLIGLLYAGDVSAGMHFVKKSRYWLLAFAITGMSLTKENREMFLKAYVAGVTFTSGLYLLQLLRIAPMKPADIAVTTPVGVITSVGLLNQWGHITFSLLIAFSLVLLSFFFKTAQRRNDRLFIIFLMSLQFLALAVLLSDSGHLAFILLSPVIAYNLLGEHPRPLKVAVLSALMVGALFLSPVTQSRFDDMVSGTVTYGESKSLTPVQGRFYMWTGALKIIADNPVFGVGTGGYQAAMRNLRINKVLPDKGVREDPTQPHNSFLYMAVSFGIPGVAALAWLFVVLLKTGWLNRSSRLGFSILAFTMVLFIGSLTGTQILSTATGMLFALSVGLQEHLDMAWEESANTSLKEAPTGLGPVNIIEWTKTESA